MTACFQNGLFHNSRFNDRQQTPYAYGFVRFGNRKKKQSHVSVADKDMQVDKTQRGGVVHSENFL